MTQQINNTSKIIRSTDSSYELPEQEIVVAFIKGSQILTKNSEDSEPRSIQVKVEEQENAN